MQKKRMAHTAVQPRPQRRSSVEQPTIIDMDALAVMTDDDLISRYRLIDDERNKVIGLGLDTRPWEDELAYVRREMHLRRSRHEAHDRYVRALEREYQDSEVGLPAADLDNSRFLRFIGMGGVN